MPRSRDGWGWTRQRLKMMMILAVQDRAHILIPLNLATLHNIKLLVNESSSRNRAAVRCGHSPEAFQAITTNLARRGSILRREGRANRLFAGVGKRGFMRMLGGWKRSVPHPLDVCAIAKRDIVCQPWFASTAASTSLHSKRIEKMMVQ